MYLATDKHEHDVIHCPEHYDAAGVNVHIEPIDLVRRLDFLLGNAMKYLFRYNLKGKPEEDLKKAAQYLDWYISDGCKTHWHTNMVGELAKIFLLQQKNYHPALVDLLAGLVKSTSMPEKAYAALLKLEDCERIDRSQIKECVHGLRYQESE